MDDTVQRRGILIIRPNLPLTRPKEEIPASYRRCYKRNIRQQDRRISSPRSLVSAPAGTLLRVYRQSKKSNSHSLGQINVNECYTCMLSTTYPSIRLRFERRISN